MKISVVELSSIKEALADKATQPSIYQELLSKSNFSLQNTERRTFEYLDITMKKNNQSPPSS
jgi:hypothetical protein